MGLNLACFEAKILPDCEDSFKHGASNGSESNKSGFKKEMTLFLFCAYMSYYLINYYDYYDSSDLFPFCVAHSISIRTINCMIVKLANKVARITLALKK